MLRLLVGLTVLAGLGSVPTVGRADDLPPPRPVEAVRPAVYYAPPFYHPRRSAYEVWQYYGVDRQGNFRPRVIALPGGGAFYLYNGKPYPWASVNYQFYTPALLGTPYRNRLPYSHD